MNDAAFGFHDLAPSEENFREAVLTGLSGEPKSLPCKLFYDARGSALFEACNALREKLARTAGMDSATARFADGSIASGEQSRKLTDLVGSGMDADGEIQPL